MRVGMKMAVASRSECSWLVECAEAAPIRQVYNRHHPIHHAVNAHSMLEIGE